MDNIQTKPVICLTENQFDSLTKEQKLEFKNNYDLKISKEIKLED